MIGLGMRGGERRGEKALLFTASFEPSRRLTIFTLAYIFTTYLRHGFETL